MDYGTMRNYSTTASARDARSASLQLMLKLSLERGGIAGRILLHIYGKLIHTRSLRSRFNPRPLALSLICITVAYRRNLLTLESVQWECKDLG